MFSLAYLLPAFAAVISVSAFSPPDINACGAAYIITNDPTGNYILAVNIAIDGTLSGVTATSTDGLGSGPNPLKSQRSIEINAAKQIVLTVNAGSNTLSMFEIDFYNPAKLTMVGSPVPSGGEFPVSIAINDQGTMACVLNAGLVNGVNCYEPDLELGLIAIPNTLRSLGLVLTTPPPATAGTPSQVTFSEDGQTLIVAVKASSASTPGFLAAWSIASDRSLSAEFIKSTAPPGSLAPFSTTPIPGTNAFLVADAAVGYDIFDFGAEHSLSASSSAFAIPGQQATCWSSFSSQSGNFYLTDTLAAIVTEVNVDEYLQGTVVRQYQQAAGSQTVDNDIATVGYSSFLYVLAAGALTIDVLDVSTAGNAIAVQTFDIAWAAEKVGVTPNFNYLVGMTAFAF